MKIYQSMKQNKIQIHSLIRLVTVSYWVRIVIGILFLNIFAQNKREARLWKKQQYPQSHLQQLQLRKFLPQARHSPQRRQILKLTPQLKQLNIQQIPTLHRQRLLQQVQILLQVNQSLYRH